MGSQMICNAVYSVCRAARIILQHPKSPFSIDKAPNAVLPRIVFLPNSPVYFDRHTLNIKGNVLSMFTLDGRIRFDIKLTEVQQLSFIQDKLKEVLLLKVNQAFYLRFHFDVDEKKEFAQEVSIPDNLHVVPHAPSAILEQVA
jgi:hypothetical protein